MVANPVRRTHLARAAIAVLGDEGPRALTHRAVDRQARLPLGTCANYFPTRAELMLAMAHEIFQLLAPDTDRLEQLADLPVEDAAAGYATYVTERLLEHPHVATALIELRLEAARSEDVRAVLAPVLQQGFEADVAFHQERGLPGGGRRLGQLDRAAARAARARPRPVRAPLGGEHAEPGEHRDERAHERERPQARAAAAARRTAVRVRATAHARYGSGTVGRGLASSRTTASPKTNPPTWAKYATPPPSPPLE